MRSMGSTVGMEPLSLSLSLFFFFFFERERERERERGFVCYLLVMKDIQEVLLFKGGTWCKHPSGETTWNGGTLGGVRLPPKTIPWRVPPLWRDRRNAC